MPVEIETFGVMLDDSAAKNPRLAGIARSYRDSALKRDYAKLMSALVSRLQAAATDGDSADAQLGTAVGKDKVVLPMLFELGQPQGRPDAVLPDYIRRNALTNIQDRIAARAAGKLAPPAPPGNIPIPQPVGRALAKGNFNVTADIDGPDRYKPIYWPY